MKPHMVLILASPRAGGNSDTAARALAEGASTAGAECTELRLREHTYQHCVECDACMRTGTCRIQDDFQNLRELTLAADILVFATPVFFMTVSAIGKSFIDRYQSLWAKKYVCKDPVQRNVRPKGAVLSVGGSRSTRMFDSIDLTMKYYFDVLEVDHLLNICINEADARGAVTAQPGIMHQLREVGKNLVHCNDRTKRTVKLSANAPGITRGETNKQQNMDAGSSPA